MTRILLTGGSAPGFSSIARSLKPHWILATDYKDSLAARQIASEYAITPNLEPYTPFTEREYLKSVIDLIDEHDIDVVVPIRTIDMQAICSHLFATPTLAVANSAEIISILNDKFRLLQQAEELNLKVPWFEKTSEFSILFALRKRVPFVMKPLVQSGSRGMRIVRNREHYPFVNDILFKKPSECINITFEQFEDIARDFDMLVMEYLPGKEYTVDCLCHEGNLLAMVPRRRDKMIGGISGVAEVVKDENFEEMLRVCIRIIKKLKLSYAVGFQFKCNEEGRPRLIECNPRLQGSTCLTVAAGLNIPKLAVQLALGEIEPDDIVPIIKWGTKFERTFREWYG
jgi:carbamoyl-phosphate synthase large subunit